jgi:hypothetical protein
MNAAGHWDVPVSVCQQSDVVQSLLKDVKRGAALLGKFSRQTKLIFNEVTQHAPICSLAVIALTDAVLKVLEQQPVSPKWVHQTVLYL